MYESNTSHNPILSNLETRNHLETNIQTVAIIGLGPAGATLARLLEPRYSVIAFDKKDSSNAPLSLKGAERLRVTDDGRVNDRIVAMNETDGCDTVVRAFSKPCGGLLAPKAQKALAMLGLSLPVELLVDPQIFAVRTLDLAHGMLRHYQRCYINMDRLKFDQWLIGMIPGRVEVVKGVQCVSVQRADNGFALDYTLNGIRKTIHAQYVVGADGANSIVRRSLFPEVAFDKRIAIQEWYEGQEVRPTYTCFFDKDITDCYAWGISKNNYFILGGAFPIHGGKRRFEELKRKLVGLGYSLGRPIKSEACLVLRPKSPFQRCLGEKGAFLIGEAAGLISPSLEGISYALNSAATLSEVFNSNPAPLNGDYAARMMGTRANLLMRHVKSLFYYSPAARRLIMKSGVGSMRVIL